jgi:hypothetical protein
MAFASRVYLKPQQNPIFCNRLQARVGRFRPSPPISFPKTLWVLWGKTLQNPSPPQKKRVTTKVTLVDLGCATF